MKENIAKEVSDLYINVDEKLALLDTKLDDNKNDSQQGIDEVKSALEKLVEDLKDENSQFLDELASANAKVMDERLDIFKEQMGQDLRTANDEFKKDLLEEQQERYDKSRKGMSVITWLLIINTCFLLAILYFIVDTLQLF